MTTATAPQSKRAPRLRLRQENEGALVRVKRDILRYSDSLGWFSAASGSLGIFVRAVSIGGRMQALVLLSVAGVQTIVAVRPEELEILS